MNFVDVRIAWDLLIELYHFDGNATAHPVAGPFRATVIKYDGLNSVSGLGTLSMCCRAHACRVLQRA